VRALGSHLAALACLLTLAGCGLGAGPAPRAVQLLVTRDFGAQVLHLAPSPQIRGQETVMSLLLRNFTVGTRYGGRFVESIDGLGAGEQGGHPLDWFYYVNGIEAHLGAADTNVHPGDHIWWDRHDWSQTDDVPAVVGSFPEPFLNGIEGKRLPVRVECARAQGSDCRTVVEGLRRAGVPAAISALAAGGAEHTLRVLVGPWPAVQGDLAVAAIEQGPRASGVYALPSHDGSTLTLLDRDGRHVRTLSGAAGLIAATRHGEDAPVWVVSGTSARGVALAARAFTAGTLKDRFAVAVLPSETVALPVVAP
jgi:hypothetical protein